jgi:hypothetical protein
MKQFDKILSNWLLSQVVQDRNRQVKKKSFDQRQRLATRQTCQRVWLIATEPDELALNDFSVDIPAFRNKDPGVSTSVNCRAASRSGPVLERGFYQLASLYD